MQIGDCARTVHESNVFIALGLASSESRFPKLLKTLETKIVDGAVGEDSGSLQAGGHRFDPGHVHQLNPRSLNHLRCNFYCTILVQFRYIRYNSHDWIFWKTESKSHSFSLIEAHLQ